MEPELALRIHAESQLNDMFNAFAPRLLLEYGILISLAVIFMLIINTRSK